ncbi:DUF309 domain-containing protein [Streptomyces sp. NPDC001070]
MSDSGPVDRARDRDTAGRARSARPRDALGRPLPYEAEGVARQPEGIRRTPDESLAEAQRLLDAGLPFHAHEVFEDAWKSASDPGERALWKGLAQFAVALTHAARGNARGAVVLLRRAADAIAPYQRTPPYAINVGALTEWAQWAADDLASRAFAAPARLTPPPLRKRHP